MAWLLIVDVLYLVQVVVGSVLQQALGEHYQILQLLIPELHFWVVQLLCCLYILFLELSKLSALKMFGLLAAVDLFFGNQGSNNFGDVSNVGVPYDN